MANKIIPYRSDLKHRARELRKHQTLAERRLWAKIRKRQLGEEFHRQVPMLDYIVDFYCHEIGLAIELDGAIHDNQFFEDAKRQSRLEKEGVTFLRFGNSQVLNTINLVMEEIKYTIEELS